MTRLTIRWLLRGGSVQLGLTQAQARVLEYLIDRGDKDGKSWPSQVRMAKELGQSRYGVQLCLDHLEAIGVVTVTAKIKGRSNGYQVHEPANPVGTPPANSTGQVQVHEPANPVGTKYLEVTEQGLPGLARSGPARPSVSQRRSAPANDDEADDGVDRARRPRQGTTSRAGNEAAGLTPPLEPRQTTSARTPSPTPVRAWASRVPGGKPDEWTAA